MKRSLSVLQKFTAAQAAQKIDMCAARNVRAFTAAQAAQKARVLQ